MDKEYVFTGHDSIFAKNLRELMKSKGTTQKELAEVIGTTRQAVAQYMDGSVQPNVEKLYKMVMFFGVSSDYIIGISNVKSFDLSDKEIGERFGLSDEALNNLRHYNQCKDSLMHGDVRIVDFLLGTEEFRDILIAFSEYYATKNLSYFDEQLSRLNISEKIARTAILTQEFYEDYKRHKDGAEFEKSNEVFKGLEERFGNPDNLTKVFDKFIEHYPKIAKTLMEDHYSQLRNMTPQQAKRSAMLMIDNTMSNLLEKYVEFIDRNNPSKK